MGETLVWTVCTILELIEGVFFYRVLCSMMEPWKNRLVQAGVWFASACVAITVIYPNDPDNVTLIFFGFLLLNTVGFKGRDWVLKISVVMLLFPIVIAVNYISVDIPSNLYGYLNHRTWIMEAVLRVTFHTACMIFWMVFWRFAKKGLAIAAEFLDTKSWIFLDVICLASLTAVISGVYFAPAQSAKMYPCMVACIVTNIGSVRLASYMADSIRTRLERQNLRLQENYYAELEKNQLQIRKFRHDLNNHFAAVGELLKEGDMKRAAAYFEELSGYLEVKNRIFCKNGIVNALLNVKYNAALEEGIDCFFHISIDGLLSMDDISLCTIFANTLDNGIEACRKIDEPEKRRMSVKARYTENGYFSYEIVNAKSNTVHEKKGRFLTDKENKKLHGLGIISVREAVEKYGGTLDISYTDEEFRVVILIEQESVRQK